MSTIKGRKAILFIHIAAFYLISTLVMNYYLGENLVRWFFQSILFTGGILVSLSNWGARENLILENLIGLLFMIVFVIQTVAIWEGYYVLKDIFAISFTWGLGLMSFYLVSKRQLTNFFIGAFILMVYNASISYDMLYIVFVLLFTFLAVSFFIMLVPPLDMEMSGGYKLSAGMFSIAGTSMRVTLIGFFTAIVIYSFLPRFWDLNFFNLPITRNQNYFARPDTSGPNVNIPGFSLEFSLTSGKVWDSPIKVMEVKTDLPNVTHYLKGAVYDTFDGRDWKMSRRGSERKRNRSWQFQMDPVKYDALEYSTDTQIITYLISIPNVLFHEPHAQVIRFPARYIIVDDSSNIYIPPIEKVPFKYSIVSEIPTKINPVPVSSLSYDERYRLRNYLRYPETTRRVNELVYSITKDLEDEYEKARALEKYLMENYTYDLEFSFLPEEDDLIDYFLFEYKRGYCEQYSTVLSILLRIAGIPSRAVTGFAGGSYDKGSGELMFRGSHAHAWTEAYFNEMGWITMDATPVAGSTPTQQRSFLQRVLGRLFNLDPQNLVPPKVRRIMGDIIKFIFNFIWANILLISILLVSIILLYYAVKYTIKYLRRREKLGEMGYCVFILEDLVHLASKRLGIKRNSWETEREFIEKLAEKLPRMEGQLRSFLTLLLFCRYSGEEETSRLYELRAQWAILKQKIRSEKKHG